MALRICKGEVLKDDREFFSFILPDGRVAETKAHTEEEARRQIEELLGTELLKRAA